MTSLYERYMPSIWRYAFSRLAGDDSVARDVVSETFLAVLQSLGRAGEAPDDVARWLSGVARHKLADHWRRSRPQKQIDEDGADPPDHGSDPVAAMDASETRRAVGEVMAGMEDAQRIALEWKYIEGLTVREMAGRLGCTEKAVEAILYRARAVFKAQYKRMNQ
jgi:RNA polymerase sigma-70 factor (ECF subfamily)